MPTAMLYYYHARLLVAVCLLPDRESAMNSRGSGDCINSNNVARNLNGGEHVDRALLEYGTMLVVS